MSRERPVLRLNWCAGAAVWRATPEAGGTAAHAVWGSRFRGGVGQPHSRRSGTAALAAVWDCRSRGGVGQPLSAALGTRYTATAATAPLLISDTELSQRYLGRAHQTMHSGAQTLVGRASNSPTDRDEGSRLCLLPTTADPPPTPWVPALRRLRASASAGPLDHSLEVAFLEGLICSMDARPKICWVGPASE